MTLILAALLSATTLQTPAVVLPDTDVVRASAPFRAPDRFERALSVPADTPQTPLVEYSDAYATRLTIHRWASWTMLPLFGAQYYVGQKLYKGDAPDWARNAHGPLAVGVGVLFGVNTITGVWNLYDSRKDPEGRTKRTIHSVLMLAADAGFAATGLITPDDDGGERGDFGFQREGGGGSRSTHRTIAVTSMGVAALSWVIMLLPLGGE